MLQSFAPTQPFHNITSVQVRKKQKKIQSLQRMLAEIGVVPKDRCLWLAKKRFMACKNLNHSGLCIMHQAQLICILANFSRKNGQTLLGPDRVWTSYELNRFWSFLYLGAESDSDAPPDERAPAFFVNEDGTKVGTGEVNLPFGIFKLQPLQVFVTFYAWRVCSQLQTDKSYKHFIISYPIISIFWLFFVFYHILVIYSQNSVIFQSHWIPFALSFTDFHLATGSCHRFHGLGHGRSVWVWILGCFCLSAILWIWSLARPVSSQGERN